MAPQIFDKDDNPRDMAWLQSKYGNVQFLDAGPGTKFRLMRIDETEGPAVIKVRVLNEQGAPHGEQPVANSWPDDELPDLRNRGSKTLWKNRGINQRTDSDGTTGFGLGTGSYIRSLADGGPHTIWVLSPSLPSDGLSGVGMLGGTDHMGPLFLTFQIGDEAAGTGGSTGGTGGTGTGGAGTATNAEVLAKLEAIHADLRRVMQHLGLS